MKRKILKIVPVIVLCFFAACVFAGCKGCTEKHVHEYGDWTIVREADCETDGLKTRACNGCEETEQETIKSAGHNYGTFLPEVLATCEKEGTKGHYECSACHKNFDSEKNELSALTIAKTDHTYGEWNAEVSATCTEDGVKGYYECSVCNKYFDKENKEIADTVIPKTHSLYAVPGQKATCTENGIKDTYRCSHCRQLFDADGKIVTDTVIPATGHTYTAFLPEVPATATENGVKAHKGCKNCELIFDEENNVLDSLVIPATGHAYSEWIDEVSATCTVDGTKGHYACGDCELKFDENYNVIADLKIPAAHNPEHFDRVEPTCTEDGNIDFYFCGRCFSFFDEDMNEVEVFVLKALGHAYGEWIDEIPATCTTNGARAHKTCSRCEKHFDADGKEIQITVPASHSFTLMPEISATCTQSGTQAHNRCSVCNKDFDLFGSEITDSAALTIAAKGHSYGEWIKEIAATCTEAGIKAHYHCRSCDKDYDENGVEIADALTSPSGHRNTTEEIIAKVEPTCTTDGTVAHFECGGCGRYTDENNRPLDTIVIEKTGHIFGSFNAEQFPTCTETGVKAHNICGKCSAPYFAFDPAVTLTAEDLISAPFGHSFIRYERIEPTCEASGREEYCYCRNCTLYFDANEEYVENPSFSIPNTGHKVGDLVMGRPATETEDGTINHYQCEKCLQYFGEDGNQVDTIVIPKLVHNFGEWRYEVSPTCSATGTKGYYVCSHCNKKFDKDYQEIDDLTIPVRHDLGTLTPARQGKCGESDILVAYRQCGTCYKYFGEDGSELAHDDIFRLADRHDDVVSPDGDRQHKRVCRDCDRVAYESHDYTYSFDMQNGAHFKKATCGVCGYEAEPEPYMAVDGVETISDFYVGYHTEGDRLFRINYRDGGESVLWASDVMSETERLRFVETITSFAEDFTPTTLTFNVAFENFTGAVDITFRPFVIYGVITEQKAYQQGYLSGIGDISPVYDCNYTRETGKTIRAYGTITDNGGFDPDFDFAANGTDTKTFIVRYNIDGKEYDVAVTLVNSATPVDIYYDNVYGYTLLGEFPSVEVVYSDASKQQRKLTPEMIVGGAFDPSVLGRQFFTISVEGVTKQISVNVRDPYEITYIYIYQSTIDIGETPRIWVNRLGANSDIIELTPDMIEGAFDNTVVGTYDVTVFYGGKSYRGQITVRDPNDTRIDRISPIFYEDLVWNIKDGGIVADLDYLYIAVNRKNGKTDYVKVTEDMISYDPIAANEAVSGGGRFDLTISYYGKTAVIIVAPRTTEALTANEIHIYEKENLSDGYTSTVYVKDGDLSNYFVKLTTNDGYYCLPLLKDLFFVRGTDSEGNETLSPFDFDNATNNMSYSVAAKYGKAQNNYITLLIYTESDIEYSFSPYNSLPSLAVGTKEEVLSHLAGTKFTLYRTVCGYGRSIGYFYFEDLILAPNEDVDFSKPGYVSLKAAYKGIVDTLYIELVPQTEGVTKTTYQIGSDTLELYENGIAYYKYSWGTYSLINEDLNVYQLTFYGYRNPIFFTTKDNAVTIFKAEMLEENLEVYSMFNAEGLCSVKVYTKNGFSLADIYDEDGRYEQTVRVTFSADGKHAYVLNVKYTIKEGNVIEIVPEGNVVYRYYEESGENEYIRGTLNDNGMFYLYMVQTDESGAVTAEHLIFAYIWIEKNGVITVYENETSLIKGTIVDGYLVIDD